MNTSKIIFREHSSRTAQAAAMIGAMLLSTSTAVRSAGETERVSASSLGTQGNGHSYDAAVSANGRIVAFHSAASNLVAGDDNGVSDIFVHDRTSGTTTRVSIDSQGSAGNGASYNAALSTDGRYVAFISAATNLVAADTNGVADVFVHDRETGATTRVSVDSNGIAADGPSRFPALSATGRFIAFESNATNLVANDTNAVKDIFVHDRVSGVTNRVSISSRGRSANGDSQYPSVSADGRYVIFTSAASNLVARDTNGALDVFVRDRRKNITTRVSVNSRGRQGNGPSYDGTVSPNGRYVAFGSVAGNLVIGDTRGGNPDIFVHDRRTRTTTRVSLSSGGRAGNGPSFYPVLSKTGRFVAFSSAASNLVPRDTNGTVDVFVHDRITASTSRVSIDTQGAQGNAGSVNPALSSAGNIVAYEADASNLVADDTNGVQDIFIHERFPLLSIAKSGTGSGTISSLPNGLFCGRSCRAAFAPGTRIALTATARPGSSFVRWRGAADCADGVVTLRADLRCTAVFRRR